MQKFKRYDLVKIAEDLGPSMSHFQSGCEAIVIGSYADEYGGNDTENYTLHIKGRGEVSWYWEWQLTLIKRNQREILELWENEEKKEEEQKADIDWIFNNGKSVLKRPHGASIKTLAAHLGIVNLWGSHGEGYVFLENATLIMFLAAKYLETGDKDGWLNACAKLQQKVRCPLDS